MKDEPFATEGNHECDNCGLVIPADKLLPIADLHERVEAGCPVPSGECPNCGALCYPVEPPKATPTQTLDHQAQESYGA